MVGMNTSVAVDGNDHTHVSYVDYGDSRVKYAFWTGAAWRIELVDDFSANDYVFSTSLALDNLGDARLAYYDNSPGDLRYARRVANTWGTEAVDTSGDVGESSALAIDSRNNPHLVLYKTTGMLRYARWDDSSSAWSVEDVVDAGAYGGSCDLALDSADRPHISYFDSDSGSLKYVHR
jgi:hypothetical protein